MIELINIIIVVSKQKIHALTIPIIPYNTVNKIVLLIKLAFNPELARLFLLVVEKN